MYSIDCSVSPIEHSRVFDKALGWLIAIILIPLAPGPPLLLWARLTSQLQQQAHDGVLFYQWAGTSARRAAAALLLRLPWEKPESFPPVPMMLVTERASAAQDAVDGPLSQTGEEALSGRDAESLALISASLGDAHLFRSVFPVPEGLRAAFDEAEGGSGGKQEAKVSVAAKDQAESGEAAGAGDADGDDEEEGEPPLLLSWADWLLEKQICSRCRCAELAQGASAAASAARSVPTRGAAAAPAAADRPATPDAAALDLFVLAAATVCFCIWTPAATAILQLFSCVRVEAHPELSPIPSPFHGRWLLHDMSQRCFEGAHLRYVLGVGIPGLAVVILGIPLVIAHAVVSRRPRLEEEGVGRRYGFLYIGADVRVWFCRLGSTRCDSCAVPSCVEGAEEQSD